MTLRAFSDGELSPKPGSGRRIGGGAGRLVSLLDRAGHFDRVTHVIAQLRQGLPMTLSEVAVIAVAG